MGKNSIGTTAPPCLRETPPQKGPRTRKHPKGTLPSVWTPKSIESADGRFGAIKLLKEKVEQLQADCGADSFQKRVLCERAGFIISLLETQEVTAIETGKLDAGSYVQTCNALIGLLKALGIERVSRKATLNEYLETKREAGD